MCMCLNEFKRILERGKKNNLLKSYFFTLLSYNVFYQMGLSLALCTSATIEKVIVGQASKLQPYCLQGYDSARVTSHTLLCVMQESKDHLTAERVEAIIAGSLTSFSQNRATSG